MDFIANLTESFATETSQEKVDFLRKTYFHLAVAILLFIVLEYFLIRAPFTPGFVDFVFSTRYSWLIVLGVYIGVSWGADKLAHSAVSLPVQYFALALFVLAEAFIFIPLIFLAVYYASPDVIPMAALITGLLFVGLSLIVLTTRKDFSFLKGVLKIGFLVAIGIILAGAVWGFDLGLAFSGGMVVLAGLTILYSTSQVLHEYDLGQYVAASLSLFASVALFFWYILQIAWSFMGRD